MIGAKSPCYIAVYQVFNLDRLLFNLVELVPKVASR